MSPEHSGTDTNAANYSSSIKAYFPKSASALAGILEAAELFKHLKLFVKSMSIVIFLATDFQHRMNLLDVVPRL